MQCYIKNKQIHNQVYWYVASYIDSISCESKFDHMYSPTKYHAIELCVSILANSFIHTKIRGLSGAPLHGRWSAEADRVVVVSVQLCGV